MGVFGRDCAVHQPPWLTPAGTMMNRSIQLKFSSPKSHVRTRQSHRPNRRETPTWREVHDCVKRGDVAALRELRWHRASMDCVDPSNGRTPAHEAARLGHATILQALVEDMQVRESLMSQDRAGKQPIHLAAMEGHSHLVLQLHSELTSQVLDGLGIRVLRDGIDGKEFMLVVDGHGRTPAHYAALYGHVEVLKVLVKLGGAQTLYKTDVYGKKPAHEAARFDHRGVLHYLGSQGADLHSGDLEGLTPAECAINSDHRELGEWLSMPPEQTMEKLTKWDDEHKAVWKL